MLWLGALLLGGCALGPSRVTRVADGVAQQGRFIAPGAYGAYARGAALEARGELGQALVAYDSALAQDEDAAEILLRIGAVSCRLAEKATDAAGRRAEAALGDALRREPELSTAWAERARCHARFGRRAEAFAAARTAAFYDPESAPVQLLAVQYAETHGTLEFARRFLDALATRSPDSRAVWQAMAQFAARHGDAARRHRAEAALARLGVQGAGALERALLARDLPEARRQATALRMRPGELALRAALAGAWAPAREQAELVLAADPGNADAWITRLVAADLAEDDAAFPDWLASAPAGPFEAPSAAAVRLLAELIGRRAGTDARRAWEDATLSQAATGGQGAAALVAGEVPPAAPDGAAAEGAALVPGAP